MSFSPSVCAFTNPSTLRIAMQEVQQGIVNGLVHGNLVATMPTYDMVLLRILMTEEAEKVDPKLKEVLDDRTFDFFWAFATAWAAFRKGQPRSPTQFLTELRERAVEYGIQLPSPVPKPQNPDTPTTLPPKPNTKGGGQQANVPSPNPPQPQPTSGEPMLPQPPTSGPAHKTAQPTSAGTAQQTPQPPSAGLARHTAQPPRVSAATPQLQLAQPPSGPARQTPQPTSGPTRQTPQPPSGPARQTAQPPSGPARQTPQPPAGPARQTAQPPSGPARQTPQPTSGPARQTPQPPSGRAHQFPPSGPAHQTPQAVSGPARQPPTRQPPQQAPVRSQGTAVKHLQGKSMATTAGSAESEVQSQGTTAHDASQVPVGRGAQKRGQFETLQVPAPKLVPTEGEGTSRPPHSEQKAKADTHQQNPSLPGSHNSRNAPAAVKTQPYVPFDEVNDDSDAYEPSETGQTGAVKRKRKADVSAAPKKKKLPPVAEDIEENDKLDSTLNDNPNSKNPVNKKARDDPIATRHVFIERCLNCIEANHTCRVQYKLGKRGCACYRCANRRIKCEGKSEETVIQDVSESEGVEGEIMPEPATKTKSKKPRSRVVRKKIATDDAQEGSADVVEISSSGQNPAHTPATRTPASAVPGSGKKTAVTPALEDNTATSAEQHSAERKTPPVGTVGPPKRAPSAVDTDVVMHDASSCKGTENKQAGLEAAEALARQVSATAWQSIEERVDKKLNEFSTLLSDIRQALTLVGLFPSPPALTITPPTPFGSQESIPPTQTFQGRLSAIESGLDSPMLAASAEPSLPPLENVADAMVIDDVSDVQSHTPPAPPITHVAAILAAHIPVLLPASPGSATPPTEIPATPSMHQSPLSPANTPLMPDNPQDEPVGGAEDEPVDGAEDEPVGGSEDEPVGVPADEPVGGPADEPVGDSADEPMDVSTVDISADKPVEHEPAQTALQLMSATPSTGQSGRSSHNSPIPSSTPSTRQCSPIPKPPVSLLALSPVRPPPVADEPSGIPHTAHLTVPTGTLIPGVAPRRGRSASGASAASSSTLTANSQPALNAANFGLRRSARTRSPSPAGQGQRVK